MRWGVGRGKHEQQIAALACKREILAHLLARACRPRQLPHGAVVAQEFGYATARPNVLLRERRAHEVETQRRQIADPRAETRQRTYPRPYEVIVSGRRVASRHQPPIAGVSLLHHRREALRRDVALHHVRPVGAEDECAVHGLPFAREDPPCLADWAVEQDVGVRGLTLAVLRRFERRERLLESERRPSHLLLRQRRVLKSAFQSIVFATDRGGGL